MTLLEQALTRLDSGYPHEMMTADNLRIEYMELFDVMDTDASIDEMARRMMMVLS